MNANPNAISAEADVLHCGYNLGFFEKADIAGWADRLIEATETPTDEMLDLSMNRHIHPMDVLRLLRTFGAAEPATSIETQIGFIGLLLSQQRITTQLAIQGLWALLYEPGTTEQQQSTIDYLDDCYDLALAGSYGTLENVQQDLITFVLPYAQRLAAQYPQLIPSKTGDTP